MTTQQAIDFLIENGYKEDTAGYKMFPEDRYFFKRTSGSDCQCNERPPSIGVTITEFNTNGENHRSMKINLRAEAINGQWVDIGYYSMPIDEVKEIKTYEYIIEKMWECAN